MQVMTEVTQLSEKQLLEARRATWNRYLLRGTWVLLILHCMLLASRTVDPLRSIA